MNDEHIELCRGMHNPMEYRYFRDLLTDELYQYSTYKGAGSWAIHTRSAGLSFPKFWVLKKFAKKRNYKFPSFLWAISKEEAERQLVLEELE